MYFSNVEKPTRPFRKGVCAVGGDAIGRHATPLHFHSWRSAPGRKPAFSGEREGIARLHPLRPTAGRGVGVSQVIYLFGYLAERKCRQTRAAIAARHAMRKLGHSTSDP